MGKIDKALLATAALAVLALLYACASPGGGSTPATTPLPSSERVATPTPAENVATPAPAVAGGEIRVTLKNRTFPEELRVKVGSRVVFVVTNQGDETHSFEFPDHGIYKEIDPGQTVRIEWTVPNKKGKWDMGCFLTDPPGVHDGMEGTLIIE